MTRAEEILNDCTADEATGSQSMNWDLCVKAMNQYAKETSIEFAEFIKDNSYTKSDKGWYKYYTQRTDFPSGFSMSTPVYEFLTIEELFQLFLDHKNKQQ